MRIVSLSPAATEIAHAIGLGRKVVGVSHDSDWPAAARSKRVVTHPTVRIAGRRSRTILRLAKEAEAAGRALAELDEETLASLRPDLVLAGDRCLLCGIDADRAREAVHRLGLDATVVSLEPTSVEGTFHAISTVGAMAGAETSAMKLVERLRRRLGRIERKVQQRRDAGIRPMRIVTLEWLDPPYAAGRWVPEQVRRAGGWDLLGRDGEPASQTTWSAIRSLDPEMIFVAPFGLGLWEGVAEWKRMRLPAGWDDLLAVRRGQVLALDGAGYTSRPGPRIVDGIAMLAELIDPAAFVDIAPHAAWTPLGYD